MAGYEERFECVAKMDRLHKTRGTLVNVGGEEILIFRRGEEVFAISNVCAHQHFSKLHEGPVEDFIVTCPMHGWSYDFRTGRATGGQGNVRRYPVKIAGNDVCIGLENGTA